MGASVRETLNPKLLGRALAGLESELKSEGVAVDFGDDFDFFEQLVSETDKPGLTEHFTTSLNTYTPETAFWIRGVGPAGETIAVGAARLDLLGEMTLDRYLRKYWSRCYPDLAGSNALPAERQPRFLREVSGRVAYFGDLWVAREWQRKNVHKALSPLAMLYAAMWWKPDWLYCWVRPSAWSKRYPLAYGYSAVHPVGIRWERPPATVDHDLVIALNKWPWLLDWLDHLAERFPVR